MPRMRFSLDSAVPIDSLLTAAVDFSDRRLELWPAIDPETYRVHAVGDTWADVTEGSRVLGGIWARERYDWSTPGVVRATVQDSNVFRPGSTWELRVRPRDGGSRIEVLRDRRGKGLKGRLVAFMMATLGRAVLRREMKQTLEALQAPDRTA